MFDIVKSYCIKRTFSWETSQREKLSLDPHDHSVFADVDLSDDYAFVFGVELGEVGVVPDGMHIADEGTIFSETEEFEFDIGIASIARQDAKVRIAGTLKGGTSLEIDHLDGGAAMQVWGLLRNDIPTEFYKETIAEALCFELEQRRKQSFFTYVTALDSLVNFQLADLVQFKELKSHVSHLELKEKLSLAIKRALGKDDISDEPIVGTITGQFGVLIEKRNNIAHSITRISVEDEDISNVVYILMVLMMIFTKGTADITSLTTAYGLKEKVDKSHSIPEIE